MENQKNHYDEFNDPNRIPISQVFKNLFEIVSMVKNEKKRVLITKNGIAIAAICPLNEVSKYDKYTIK